MNEIISPENYINQLYQIIGSESQVLQLVLLPHQYILTSKNWVSYFSPNLTLTFKHDWIDYGILNTIIENNTDSIGYIGLSNFFSGKVSAIRILQNSDLLVRSDKILATTENCKFSFFGSKANDTNNESQKQIISFCKPERFEYHNEIKKNMIEDPFKKNKNIDHSKNKETGINCYLFLQSESNQI